LYGGIAGFVFSVLYLAPQWAGDNGPFAATAPIATIRWQMLFAPILALTGGLAADSVLASLQKGGDSRAAHLPAVPLSPGGTGIQQVDTGNAPAAGRPKRAKRIA